MDTGAAYARLLMPFLLTTALLAWGCTGEEPGLSRQDKASGIVARVDGTPITEHDVALLAQRTLDINDASGVDEQTRTRLIESLVKSRAMAVQAEKALTKAELAEIDRKTAAFREELLVDRYIRNNAGFAPITSEMIREYYAAHPGEFGGKKIKTFEYVTGGVVADEQTRDRVIAEVGRLSSIKDWKKAVDGLSGLGLAYHKASMPVDMLKEPLRPLVEKTATGRVSELSMGREIVMARVLDEQDQPARPLEEVSAEIRKKLAPMVMKELIQNVSAEALSHTDVIYAESRN